VGRRWSSAAQRRPKRAGSIKKVTSHNGKAGSSVRAGKPRTLFPPVAKVLDARGPGATAARRQPFWACLTRVIRRLRASPGAQRLEK